MFLVSNTAMVKSAIDAGITGAIPALNYRTLAELEAAIDELKQHGGAFGINLIVNKSNLHFKEQLEVCVRMKVPFLITSLGSPESTIQAAKANGIKVFCDVTDHKYAAKVVNLGADALIAVNNRAGGHLGNLPPEELIPSLVNKFDIPVISAGGVGDFQSFRKIMDLGACGVSVGSIFIASDECKVSQAYKEAVVQYGKNDIVVTEKLSGTPCTVINTPYVLETGTRLNLLERMLLKNRRLRKWVKTLTFIRGMNLLNKAAFSNTYQTVWCAGETIEYVHSIRPVAAIVKDLMHENGAIN